jgi:hypothetical protein
MQKKDWNFLVNVLLFVDMCSVAALGLMLGYIIPRGRAGDKVFLGLHRHDWGDIHLNLSFALLVLIILHLYLNWNWVRGTFRTYFGDRSKQILIGLCFAWIGVLVVAWLVSSPDPSYIR